MKKLLYTTSALVGAAFLMEAVAPAKAEVNMSLRYRAALISKSQKDAYKDKDLTQTGKEARLGDPGQKDRSTSLNSAKINIDLSASKDHPNGLTTSATVAMSSGKNKWDYDNAFGSIAGSFGKIDVGDFHDVGYRALGYGTPGTSNFGAIDAGFQPSGGYVNTSATGNIGARASSIAYWSPSFSGAQVGISWAPQVTTGGLGSDQAGVEGKKASLVSKQGDIEDSLGFVATYSGSFGGTGLSMGVSFENAKTVGVTPASFKDDGTGFDGSDVIGKNTVGALSRAYTAFLESETIIGSGSVYIIDKDNKLADVHSNVDSDTDIGAQTKTQDPTAFAGYVSFDIGQFTVGGSYGSWEAAADSNGRSTSESTAYALGASYSVDAITFGVGWGTQSTDNTHYNVRKVGGTIANDGATEAQVKSAAPFKQTLDNDILAFTVGYQLGDGAAIDFVIEQSTKEMQSLTFEVDDNNRATDVSIGKEEVKSSGFGVGIDLKF